MNPRRLPGRFLFFCLLLIPGWSPAQSSAPDAKAIAAVLASFHKALAENQPERALALLAPDALIVEAGGVQTRLEYQEEHLSADIAFARAVSSAPRDMVIRQDGKVAWVTTTFHAIGKFQARPIDQLAAETATLARTPEGWRIRLIHWSSQPARASEIGPAPPPKQPPPKLSQP